MKILITGWAGFIGSNLTRMLLNHNDQIMGFDSMTYAARPAWAREAALKLPVGCFEYVQADLRRPHAISTLIHRFRPDQVYHLAAESHVCRSIDGPRAFAESNFMGTFNLLEALRTTDFHGRLVHVSTDEAFGELRADEEPFHEERRIEPRSPYSASKAASDLMVQAYSHTYGLNAVLTRCTNNYGPNQHEEKLIPRTIGRLLRGEQAILHGDGTHIRDWIHVEDHCAGLIQAMAKGRCGELYCLGSGLELQNRQVVELVRQAVERVTGKAVPREVLFTDDRPTDDARYAVDVKKAIVDLDYRSKPDPLYFRARLEDTVRWYISQGNGVRP